MMGVVCFGGKVMGNACVFNVCIPTKSTYCEQPHIIRKQVYHSDRTHKLTLDS